MGRRPNPRLIKIHHSYTVEETARRLDVEISDAALQTRLAAWRPPVPRYTSGVMAKYAALVSSAAEGAITRPR